MPGNYFAMFEGELDELAAEANRRAGAGECVRVVRGTKMPDVASALDEFAAALQFPWYFGDNLDAFDECIADLSWLQTVVGYTIVISHAASLLRDEPVRRQWLVESLTAAGEELSGATDFHPGLAFQVLLHVEPDTRDEVRAIWTGACAL